MIQKEHSIEIVRYTNAFKQQWDRFVDEAKNGTFLFRRDFMEYHKDRFEDYSLMIFKGKKLKAVLPANKVQTILYSHQGLSYGGLIVHQDVRQDDFFDLQNVLKDFLKQKKFDCFISKQKQFIYNEEVFAWEQLYFKDILNNELNLTADLLNLTISKSKLKHYKRSEKKGFQIKKETCLLPFWETVLQPLLRDKYQVKPVHSLDEIQHLRNKFPDNIQQYSLYYQGEIVAGITVFVSRHVVKSQYGAATILGKELRAMDYLFINLLYHFKDLNYLYFDMGTVTDPNFEEGINNGLLQQKIELGCKIANQVTFKLKIE